MQGGSKRLVCRNSTWKSFSLRYEYISTSGAHLFRGFALIQDDAVSQVSCHDEVVLHNERCFLAVHDEPLNALHSTGHSEHRPGRYAYKGIFTSMHAASGEGSLAATNLQQWDLNSLSLVF